MNSSALSEILKSILESPQLLAIATQLGVPALTVLLVAFAGVMVVAALLLIAIWLLHAKPAPLQDADAILHRMAALETMLSDLRFRSAETVTKLQGEVLYLRSELEQLRESRGFPSIEAS